MTTDIEVWNEATVRTAVTPVIRSYPVKRTSPSAVPSGRQVPPASGGGSNTDSNNKFQPPMNGVRGNCERNTNQARRRRQSHAKDNRSAEKDTDYDSDDDDEEDEEDDDYEESEQNASTCKTKVNIGESEVPVPLDRKQKRLAEMQRMKANCKREELDALKVKCQVLIRDCVGGLLVNLSQQEFKEMEGTSMHGWGSNLFIYL